MTNNNIIKKLNHIDMLIRECLSELEKPSNIQSPRESSVHKNTSGPTGRIQKLIDDDFFRSKKTIGDVQSKLAEVGHIYPVTSLSNPLLRLTRVGAIRRIKDTKEEKKTKAWVYVNK